MLLLAFILAIICAVGFVILMTRKEDHISDHEYKKVKRYIMDCIKYTDKEDESK